MISSEQGLYHDYREDFAQSKGNTTPLMVNAKMEARTLTVLDETRRSTQDGGHTSSKQGNYSPNAKELK